MDGLPDPVTRPLAATLLTALHPEELSRVLALLVDALTAEARALDAHLAARLEPVLHALL